MFERFPDDFQEQAEFRRHFHNLLAARFKQLIIKPVDFLQKSAVDLPHLLDWPFFGR
ncbi:hypothetical protein D3C72_647830 [compost metagenome]